MLKLSDSCIIENLIVYRFVRIEGEIVIARNCKGKEKRLPLSEVGNVKVKK